MPCSPAQLIPVDAKTQRNKDESPHRLIQSVGKLHRTKYMGLIGNAAIFPMVEALFMHGAPFS